jgi:hypothetical protein
VSNNDGYSGVPPQQQGWGPQPPAGQYPPPSQYQQPGQYQQSQYAPPGGQGPRKRTGLIVLSVFGAVVVIAGLLFGISKVVGSDDKPAAVPMVSYTPSARPTATSTTPKSRCIYCFPTMTAENAAAQLKHQGLACAIDGGRNKCSKDIGPATIAVSVNESPGDPKFVGTLSTMGSSGGPGAYLQGRGEALKILNDYLPGVFTIAMPGEAALQQQGLAWAKKNMPSCDSGKKVKIGQYGVSCLPMNQIGVGGKAGTVTTWVTSLDIQGPPEQR